MGGQTGSLALPVTAALDLSYNSILELLIAGGDARGLSPQFTRDVVSVAPGSSAVYTMATDPGNIQLLVYKHLLRANPYTNAATLSLQIDALPKTLTNVPLGEPVDTLGAFLPPARNQLLYTIVNNGADQVDVTIDLFTVSMSLVDYRRLQKGLEALFALLWQEMPVLERLQRMGVAP